MRRAHTALTPAAGELAGAGSGLLTLGPVPEHLTGLAAALGRAWQSSAGGQTAEPVRELAHGCR